MGTAQRRLTHKGHIMETPEGELLLVNENGVAYRVNESVIAVWSLFEDKTVDEVVEEVSKELQIDPDEIRQAIADLAEQLIQAELLA